MSKTGNSPLPRPPIHPQPNTNDGRQILDQQENVSHRCFPRRASRKTSPTRRVFKIEILKISGSALAAEICTGPHNRLLQRQHCSSLCSQSEGHEHIANMTNALGHDFVGFSARAWPPQYSPPSLCEQSELQCFAPGLRQMSARCPLQRCHTRYAICSQNRTDIFLDFEHPLRGQSETIQGICSHRYNFRLVSFGYSLGNVFNRRIDNAKPIFLVLFWVIIDTMSQPHQHSVGVHPMEC